MARVSGIISNLSGTAGTVTFCRRNGQTYLRERIQPKATKVFTQNQATRSMRMANVAQLWRSFNRNLRPSFEGCSDNENQFRRFMSLNLREPGLFLTKDEAAKGTCIVNNYVVSEGTLTTVEVTLDTTTHKAKTNIALGSGFALDQDTTVKAFTNAVLSNNPARFLDGDLITIFYAKQMVSDSVPKVQMVATQLQLDANDDITCVLDVVNPDLFATNSGFLGSSVAVEGGISVVHSRLNDGKTLCSPQRFVCNNSALVLSHSSKEHLVKAVKSYGKLRETGYLTPTFDDDEAPQGPNI